MHAHRAHRELAMKYCKHRTISNKEYNFSCIVIYHHDKYTCNMETDDGIYTEPEHKSLTAIAYYTHENISSIFERNATN